MPTDFKNSIAALAVYDAGSADRGKAWVAVETNEAVFALQAADNEARELVQLAFYEDTKGFNSKDSCLCVDIDFIRHTAGLPPLPGSISIGNVDFGTLTGEKYEGGGDKWVMRSVIGDERVQLLQKARDGQPLPEKLVLVGRVFGGYFTINRDAVNWAGLRS